MTSTPTAEPVPTPVGRPASWRPWIVLGAVCLMYGASVGVIGNSAGLYLRPVASDMGWSLSSLNSYLTIVSIVMTATLPVAGWVLPRVRIHVALALALTLATGTYAASAQFSQLWHWYVAGVLLGISYGFLLYIPVPLIVNAWFRQRTGLAIGIAAAFASLVAAVANPIGGSLIESVGWRDTRVIMGAAAWLMSVPVVLLLIRAKPQDVGAQPFGAGAATVDDAPAPAGQQASPALWRAAVRTPTFICVAVLSGLFAFGASMLQQVPSHADSVGLDATTGATGVSAIMVGGIIGKLLLGELRDRRGVLVATLLASTLGVLGPVLVIASGGNTVGFLIGCAVFGGAYGGLVVLPPLLVRHFFGTVDYSRIYSLVTVSLGVFAAIAPVLYSGIFDRTGSFNGAWVACLTAFVLIAVLALVASAWSRRHPLVTTQGVQP